MRLLRWVSVVSCFFAGCSDADGDSDPGSNTGGSPTSATGGSPVSAGGAADAGAASAGSPGDGGVSTGGASTGGSTGGATTGIAGASSLVPPLCPWDSPFTATTPHEPCENEGDQCRLSHHADCSGPPCDLQICDFTVREGVESSRGVFYRSVCQDGFWETEQDGNCAEPDDFICDCPSPEDLSALPDEAALTSRIVPNTQPSQCALRETLSVGVELEPAVDGVMNATISCTVAQTESGFLILAEIDAPTNELDLDDPAAPPYTQQFSIEASYPHPGPLETGTADVTTTDSLSQTTQSFRGCTLTPRRIAATEMAADFSCEGVADPEFPEDACVMSGSLILEHCAFDEP